MKPFEFITAGEVMECGAYSPKEFALHLNRLLNEKARKGTTFVNGAKGGICAAIVTDLDGMDTHEAAVFLRPIEEEKAGCDHRLTRPTSGMPKNIITVLIDFKEDGWISCPKCGEKL